MSAPDSGTPHSGKPPQPVSTDAVICIIEGEEDSTIRPLRPEIARHLRRWEQQPPPDQPPAPERP